MESFDKAQNLRVALVYDRVNKWGGAERVLLALHKIFPDAPLYTSIYDKRNAPWAKVFKVQASFLQNFPFAMHHELYVLSMPFVFESFNFDEYDLVISVTSEAAKGIITKPHTKHICICLTPTRYLWSGYKEYFNNMFLRFLSYPLVKYLRYWDKIASYRPDKYIAISKEVQRRIKKYYGRDSEVIYPPAKILSDSLYPLNDSLEPSGNTQSSYEKETFPTAYNDADTKAVKNVKSSFRGTAHPYFLIVSRLVPYKKIDLAIKVFNKLKLSLKIVGTGSDEIHLKQFAGPTIEFLGNLTDKELVRYYSGCKALVFPGFEDFGLVVLEAQGFGKPVIAFKAGGALETVIEGKTGIFFDNQSVESLENAVGKFENLKFNPEDCIANTEKFSFENFEKGIRKTI